MPPADYTFTNAATIVAVAGLNSVATVCIVVVVIISLFPPMLGPAHTTRALFICTP